MAVADRPPHRSKIYSEFSHFYDRIFTRVFYPRIESTIRNLRIPPGARVLEVGVGTGLSLDTYPSHAEVVGVDLAQGMLDHAQRKIQARGWTHVRLQQMDAMNLSFEDDSFDYVTAFHLVSVVPDPGRVMREMSRVCKPGGRMVIINHFRSEKPWLAPIVDAIDPFTRTLGWRTTLGFTDLFHDVPAEVEQRFKTSNLSLFTVAIARKNTQTGSIRATA